MKLPLYLFVNLLLVCLGNAQLPPPVSGQRVTLLYEWMEVPAAEWDALAKPTREDALKLVEAGKGKVLSRGLSAARPGIIFQSRWEMDICAISRLDPEIELYADQIGPSLRAEFPAQDLTPPLTLTLHNSSFQRSLGPVNARPFEEINLEDYEELKFQRAGRHDDSFSLTPGIWQLLTVAPIAGTSQWWVQFVRADAYDLGPAPGVTLTAGLPETVTLNPDLRLEWIEMDLPVLRGLVDGGASRLPGSAFHQEVGKLVETGQAKLAGTLSMPVRITPRNFVRDSDPEARSHAEDLEYPVEFEPVKYDAKANEFVPPLKAQLTDTRRLGYRGEASHTNEFRLETSHTAFQAWREWGPKEWQLRMPDFHSTWVHTDLSWRQGIWHPLVTVRPAPSAERPDARTLVFARLDRAADPQTVQVAPELAAHPIRLEWEIWELSQAELTTLMALPDFTTRGPEFRQALVGAKARLADTGICSARSGTLTWLRSEDELMFPWEFAPPREVAPGKKRLAHPLAWETYPLGSWISFTPTRDLATGWIELDYGLEWKTFLRMAGPITGQPAVQFPEIHEQYLGGNTALRPGELALMAIAVKPGPEPAPAWVWFVRAE